MSLEEEEDQRHVTAAEGFLEHGLPLDADAELERIDPFCRHLPKVLEVRAKIYTALGKWELLAVVAKRLWDLTEKTEWAAELAHALRKSGAIESARAVLLDAVEKHPRSAAFHYQLACYECQLGEIAVSKGRLAHAFNLDPSLRARALDEADLSSLF